MERNNINREFVSENLVDSLSKLQIELSNRVAELATLGFISEENYDCVLSVSSLLINAFDNYILYNKTQFDNILYLYNKVRYE